jgi:Tfp pilus assembly protein PilF
MKNNTLRVKRRLIAIAISILTSSSTMAAIYDLPENQQSNFNDLDQIGVQPDELESSSSFLETLQQNENSNKKKSYLEIFDLLKQNKLADARTEITALLAQNPREPEFYNLQALLEILEKDTTSARQSFQKAIQLDPDNLTAYLGLAKLTLDADDLNKAKEYSNKALAINNKSIKAYLVLADIAHKEKIPGK